MLPDWIGIEVCRLLNQRGKKNICGTVMSAQGCHKSTKEDLTKTIDAHLLVRNSRQINF